MGFRFNKFAGSFHKLGQVGSVKFEEILAGCSVEVILPEGSLDIFHYVIKEVLLECFQEDVEDVVSQSGRFGEFFRRWSGFQFLRKVLFIMGPSPI